MNFLAVIPARGGSKGLPKKNLRKIQGRSLTQLAVNVAKQLPNTHVCLTSDSPKILGESAKDKDIFLLTRPDRLSQDETRDQEVISHAVRLSENHFGFRFDAVILLQPTAPTRTSKEIAEALLKFKMLDNFARSSLWSVSAVPEKFAAVKQIYAAKSGEFTLQRVSHLPPRRQDLTPHFIRNGEFYIIGREAIGDPYLVGEELHLHLTTHPSVNIDSLEDLKRARFLLKELGKHEG